MQYSHSVFWENPYTQPPNGLPKCLFQLQNSDRRPSPKLQAKLDAIIDRQWRRGLYTYSQGWTYHEDPEAAKKRKWSDERKFANRLRLLKLRVAKKYSIPELYEAELARQIALKPEYFGIKPQTTEQNYDDQRSCN